MKLEWLEKLKADNKIFINHLNNYPETKLGKEVGDDLEGMSSSEISIGHYTSSKDSKDDPLLQMLGIGSVNSTVTITDSTSFNEYVDNNYFVYCVCLNRNPSIQEAFGSGLQIIHDFNTFIQEITRELEKLGIVFHDAGYCKYLLDRKEHFTENDFSSDDKKTILTRPYLIKEKRYEYQNEFRVVWRYADHRKIEKPIEILLSKALRDTSHLVDLERERNKKKRKKRKKK